MEERRPVQARSASEPPTLLLLKGPPGTGKSTIANQIGRRLAWPVVDKDVVRDLLPDELGGLSYEAMLELATRQLANGLSVIADSPLGYGRAYRRAIEIGHTRGAHVLVLECICSDATEWRRRIEQRADKGMAAHHTTDWAGIEAFRERTAGDPFEVDVPTLIVDNVAPPDETMDRVLLWLDASRRGGLTRGRVGASRRASAGSAAHAASGCPVDRLIPGSPRVARSTAQPPRKRRHTPGADGARS